MGIRRLYPKRMQGCPFHEERWYCPACEKEWLYETEIRGWSEIPQSKTLAFNPKSGLLEDSEGNKGGQGGPV